MRIPRIYTSQSLQPNREVMLESGPSTHIARALRMSIGDSLVLFNGSGGEYPSTISAIEKKIVRATTGDLQTREAESPLAIELGIAISRGDRMDWVIQKATELGVASITPLRTTRTEVKLKAERLDKKLEHWRQIIVSACEQSGRNQLPALTGLQQLDQWLPRVNADHRFVLHHRDTEIDKPSTTPKSIALLIGPEGGLSQEEIALAQQCHFEALTLGPRIMRTETAPLAAISILQAKWGDMSLYSEEPSR